MKYVYLIFALVASSSLSAADSTSNREEDDITYESLISNGYTDHIPAFQKLFQCRKINTFLEFGLGRGTKYFIENCNKVISIELISTTSTPRLLSWYLKAVNMFSHHANWTPYLLRCSPLMDLYDSMASKGIVPKENFNGYLQDVETICSWALGKKTIDLVFIDQGMLPRGDFVNALFGKVNIIAAHDTNYALSLHAYDRVKDDPNYVKIHYKKGCGTTFWVKKEDQELIQYLQKAFRE
jgi:hypothetical protein